MNLRRPAFIIRLVICLLLFAVPNIVPLFIPDLQLPDVLRPEELRPLAKVLDGLRLVGMVGLAACLLPIARRIRFPR